MSEIPMSDRVDGQKPGLFFGMIEPFIRIAGVEEDKIPGANVL